MSQIGPDRENRCSRRTGGNSCCKESVEAMQNMILEKATGPSEVREKIICKNGIKEMTGQCQLLLNSKEIANEWKTTMVLPILKGKSNATSRGLYRGVELLDVP